MGGHGVVRIELERHVPHAGRTDMVAGNFQHAGELLIDADFIGPGFDRGAQFLNRLVIAAEPVVRRTQITEDIDPLRNLIFEDL